MARLFAPRAGRVPRRLQADGKIRPGDILTLKGVDAFTLYRVVWQPNSDDCHGHPSAMTISLLSAFSIRRVEQTRPTPVPVGCLFERPSPPQFRLLRSDAPTVRATGGAVPGTVDIHIIAVWMPAPRVGSPAGGLRDRRLFSQAGGIWFRHIGRRRTFR